MTGISSRIVGVAGLLCVLATAVACGGASSGPAPTPTLSPQRVLLEEKIADWEALGIDSYTVRVTYRKPDWNPQVMDLRVVRGEASFDDFECFPERTCFKRPLEPQDFTLDAIFEDVRPLADANSLREFVYNDQFGFPRIITNGEEGWEISNFQPLR